MNGLRDGPHKIFRVNLWRFKCGTKKLTNISALSRVATKTFLGSPCENTPFFQPLRWKKLEGQLKPTNDLPENFMETCPDNYRDCYFFFKKKVRAKNAKISRLIEHVGFYY